MSRCDLRLSRILCGCRVLLPESFIWFCLLPDLHLRRSFCSNYVATVESLPSTPFNCVLILRLRGVRVKGKTSRFTKCYTIFKQGLFCYLPATLRICFGLAGSSINLDSSSAGCASTTGSVVSWDPVGARICTPLILAKYSFTLWSL